MNSVVGNFALETMRSETYQHIYDTHLEIFFSTRCYIEIVSSRSHAAGMCPSLFHSSRARTKLRNATIERIGKADIQQY